MNEKLREGIKDILEYETSLCLNPTEVGKDDCGFETGSVACAGCQLDQILAIIPDIEEAKKQERERIIDLIENTAFGISYTGDYKAALLQPLKEG